MAFLDGANPVLGAAVLPGGTPKLPMVVLVVQDADDDELVSAMSEATMVPAEGYGGGWAAQIAQGALIRLGRGWERAWTYPGPPDVMLDAVTGGEHHVAILPRELAGDLGELNPASLSGSIIVEVQPSDSVSAARTAS